MSINLDDIRECYYQPGKPGIIDAIHPNTGVGLYSKETLEQIRERYSIAQYPGVAFYLKGWEQKWEPVRVILLDEETSEEYESHSTRRGNQRGIRGRRPLRRGRMGR
jgi:hypothetical protein